MKIHQDNMDELDSVRFFSSSSTLVKPKILRINKLFSLFSKSLGRKRASPKEYKMNPSKITRACSYENSNFNGLLGEFHEKNIS